jgi:hypothetical protein
MNKFQVFLKKLFRLRNFAPVASITIALLGTIFAADTSEQLRYLLASVGVLGVDALAARLDVLSNIEENVQDTSLAVKEIKHAVKETEMTVITEDARILSIILDLVERRKIKEVMILSSGLTTRKVMVERLLEKGIHVVALIQDPMTALDRHDKRRVYDAVEWVQHHRGLIQSGLFDARFHIDVSTVRAIILSEQDTDTKYIFVSWYYYAQKNTKVYGDINPSIYCTTDSKQGADIYKWLVKVFEKDLKESRKITIKELMKLEKEIWKS